MPVTKFSVFTLKVLCVAIGAAFIAGCQSSAGITRAMGTSIQQHSAIVDTANTPAAIAKARLIEAYRSHISAERYALSTYRYQAEPLDDVGGVDIDADSLWTTALKLTEYRANQQLTDHAPNAYRTTADYAAEDQSLPYLRYDDEIAGRVPEGAVSRAVAFSDGYGAVNDEIRAFNEQQRYCDADLHHQLKEAAASEPNLNLNSSVYKELRRSYDDCLKDIEPTYDALAKKAQGYQVGVLSEMKACDTVYENDLRDILSPLARNQSAVNNKATSIEIASRQWFYCRAGKGVGAFDSEPLTYLADGVSEDMLKLDSGVDRCIDQMQSKYNALRLSNKNYQNNADEFASNYYDAVNCAAIESKDILPDADIDLIKPTSTEEAHNINKQLVRAYLDHKTGAADTRPAISQWFDSYKQMKTAELNGTKINPIRENPYAKDTPLPLPEGMGGVYANILSVMLEHIKKTPEQIQAKNLYQYQNTVMTTLSHHQPSAQRIDSVLALDYHSATARQSMQLPISMDLQAGQITADVSAGLPLLALASPKHALMPADIAHGTMRFRLPEILKDSIPMALIFDSINRASVQALAEFNSELYTPMDIRHDNFARKVGASQAIKLNFGLKEAAKGMAVIAKIVAADMKAYVDEYPERYTGDTAKLKQAIDNWTLVNKGYRTDDAGSIYQLIEAVMPMNFTGSWYVYLDSQGRLVGTQQIASTDNHLENVRLNAVTQTSFSKQAATSHPLFAKLIDQEKHGAAVDGNQWLKSIKDDLNFKNLAATARADYKSAGEINWENCDEIAVDESGNLICVIPTNAAARASSMADTAYSEEAYQSKRTECGDHPVVIDDDEFACLSHILQAPSDSTDNREHR